MAEFKLVVDSSTQVSEALAIINGDIDIKVEADNVDDLKTCLSTITAIELNLLEKEKQWRVTTHLKHLPFDLRVAAIYWAIDEENVDKVVDSTLILNVFNLIKGYNSFDPSFFKSQHVLFNSIVELADTKIKLKSHLTDFITMVCKYYLSILRSASVTEYMPADKPVKLPAMMDCLFKVLDMITLSSLLRKTKTINTDALFNVENASGYLLVLCHKYALGNQIAKDTLESGE